MGAGVAGNSREGDTVHDQDDGAEGGVGGDDQGGGGEPGRESEGYVRSVYFSFSPQKFADVCVIIKFPVAI